MKSLTLFFIVTVGLLSGCEQISRELGLDAAERKEAKADAEGRAVGSACRQSGRAIEDCYSLYRWLPKASIFAGWREMNDYMVENKLAEVDPKLPPAPGPEEKKKKGTDPAEASAEKKPADAAAKSEASKSEVPASGKK